MEEEKRNTREFEQFYEKMREEHQIYQVEDFITDLIDCRLNNYIKRYFKYIIQRADIENLIDSGLLKELALIAPEEFKENKKEIVAKLTGIDKKILEKSGYLEPLTQMIEELEHTEQTDLSEIQAKGGGSYSVVYQLGDKILKFGKERETPQIINHRRILQPLIRKQIIKNPMLFMEIAENVQRDISITQEDIYLIYKEMRKDGIVWCDPKVGNVGRLLKKNLPYLGKQEIYVDPETVGLKENGNKDQEPLEAGELVVIDTDMIYQIEEYDLEKLQEKGIDLSLFYKFEKRYQNEKLINKENER